MNTNNAQNKYTYYVGANPVTSLNRKAVEPTIDESVSFAPFSVVIGDVTIKKNVYLAPHVSVRADEGAPFLIDEDTNLQDGATLHGLAHGRVTYDGKEYSIYVGKRVSCAHGAVIHGPCYIGNDVFVGFNAVILNAKVEDGCFIGHNAYVTGGITVPANKLIAPGITVATQEDADNLPSVEKSNVEFAEEVIEVNCEFPNSYNQMFGDC